ncbi:uncharacterized protein LOC110020338 [Phalaenopsis equestris]|uniref:uncharacterized protein LOC110020338 n=1 Tax=Phalaenopsis equestris TaxID=78828 RepID=UPI0009E52819|nr:uncharacterized protein LOC110020338 [Phalaenopsis equestris]
MHIQRDSDALLRQVFQATLKGQARTWFYSLPWGTVNTFNELARLFVEQFVANRQIINDSSHLSGIHQSKGESLKDYFRRFSTEARQIPGVDPDLLRGVFLGGLRPGPLYSSLIWETVRSYADLVYRVEAQISADDVIIAHKEQFERLGGKRKNNLVQHSAARSSDQRSAQEAHSAARSSEARDPFNVQPRSLEARLAFSPLSLLRASCPAMTHRFN